MQVYASEKRMANGIIDHMGFDPSGYKYLISTNH